MRHGSLFSGIGGFDLAAEWMGWENVFHCEYAAYPSKILKQHFPNAISYHDIKNTDFNIHRGDIDILTGGFPCQPYSLAGKRKGKEDERHLWPEMLRAIREIQPTWVVGENVFGITNWNGGMVFNEVQTEMEAEGYEVQPFILPACAVNAPHRRDRVWFIAHSVSNGHGSNEQLREYRNGSKEFTANANIDKRCERRMHPNETAISELDVISLHAQRNEWYSWNNFPTQSPLCGRNDGVSNRVDRIKALGNAIVPQVALQIFKTIEKYNGL